MNKNKLKSWIWGTVIVLALLFYVGICWAQVFVEKGVAYSPVFKIFVDDGDGLTVVDPTFAAVDQAYLSCTKDGTITTVDISSNTFTSLGPAGAYEVSLTTTNMNRTAGSICFAYVVDPDVFVYNETSHFQIIPTTQYNAITSSGGRLPVNVAQISGDATAADNAESVFDNTGYSMSNSKIGSALNMRGTDGAYTGTPPTAVQVRQEMDSNSTQLIAIVADTNEIQGKLPTNYIMGSSTQANMDDDITSCKDDLNSPNQYKADVSGVSTYDPTTDTVIVSSGSKSGYSLAADQSGVTIGTCTTNTDMRGTDNAALASALTTHDNRLGTVEDHIINTGNADWVTYGGGSSIVDANIVSWNGTGVASPDTAGYPVVTVKDGTGAGEIGLTAGAIDNVTLVATTTTNTDMRGTDNAALASDLTTVNNLVTSNKASLVTVNNLVTSNKASLVTVNNLVTSNKASLVTANNGITSLKSGVDVTSVLDDSTIISRWKLSLNTMVQCTVNTGITSGSFRATCTPEITGDDRPISRTIYWLVGSSLYGEGGACDDYIYSATGADTFGISGQTAVPQAGDQFIIH